MILNRIDPGTKCIVRSSGKEGKVNKIFFYPTKFEIEFDNGQIGHFTSKDLKFEGIDQKEATLKIPEIPNQGIGDCWFSWSPFKSASFLEHHFSTTKEIMWKVITSLEMYNVWFQGIQRALPLMQRERYVHKYSFDQFNLEPGAYFKIRPMTIAPWFNCRIMTIEKNKKFGFTFKTNPFNEEFILFTIRETKYGVWVACERSSEGIFSILNQLNWSEDKKILQNLDLIIPKVNPNSNTDSDSISAESLDSAKQSSTLSKEDTIAYLVNKGLDGDMDEVNNNNDKIIRGKVKAMIIKINRGSVERPPMPKIQNGDTSNIKDIQENETKEEKIARLVSKGLEGDMDEINSLSDKVLRGKIKAAIIKTKRSKG